MTAMPLKGIRVLDFGQVVSVPFCGQFLAWMGADVIMMETTTNTTTRGTPPFAYGVRSLDTSGTANSLATNKRSFTINLKTSKGVELTRQLVAVSDVVMDNFATRTMPKLGLGYRDLHKIRPDIVVLSLSAFGRTGPMKDSVGLHSAVNFFSGVGHLTGYGPEDRPRILGSIVPDPLAGTVACLAIQKALYYRQKTGRGQFIDLSMSEVFASLIPEAISTYGTKGTCLKPIGNRDPYKAPQGVYRCKGKDAWLAISVGTEHEWRAMCKALGQSHLAQDPRFGNVESRWRNHDELDLIITSWTKQRTDYEGMMVLQRAGVPSGACLNPKQLLNDPHLQERKTIARTDHPRAGRRRMIGMPWKVDGETTARYRPAPLMGEQTDEVLTDLLGLSTEQVRRLRAEDVLT